MRDSADVFPYCRADLKPSVRTTPPPPAKKIKAFHSKQEEGRKFQESGEQHRRLAGSLVSEKELPLFSSKTDPRKAQARPNHQRLQEVHENDLITPEKNSFWLKKKKEIPAETVSSESQVQGQPAWGTELSFRPIGNLVRLSRGCKKRPGNITP